MKTIFAKLIAVAALALFAAACADVLSPSVKNNAEKGLLITVSGGAPGSRTLYPSPAFTKYVLEFESVGGGASYGPVTLDGKTSILIGDLPAGNWKITATGYVMINGIEYQAAQGEGTVNVASGSFQSLGIEISASQAGEDGVFSYDVAFPSTKGVSDARLEIRKFFFDGSGYHSFDLLNDSSGSIDLAPGYYLMTVWLYNHYQTAGRTEVVHIYSNMETKAEYTFAEADFTDLITLSGTANITVNGEAAEYVYISLHDENGYGLGNSYVNLQNGNAWSMKMAAFDTDTELYFRVEFNYNGRLYYKEAGTVTARDSDIANINLAVEFRTITLSGTANITVNGVPLDQISNIDRVTVDAYPDESNSYNWMEANVDRNNNTWSMTMDAFDTDTVWKLYASIYYNGWLSKEAVTVTLRDTDIPNINIAVDLSPITLSGTVTINGAPPDSVRVTAYAYRDDGPTIAGSAYVDLQNGNTWSIMRMPFAADTVLHFSAEATYGIHTYRKGIGSVTVKDADVGNIDFTLGDVITLSGTANITVNGATPDSAYVYAYSDANNYVGDAYVDLQNGNTWDMGMLAFDTNTVIYFRVVFDYNGRGYQKEAGTVTARDSDIANINLAVEYRTITLSGTVNITGSEVTLNYAYVEAYLDEDYQNQVGVGGGSLLTCHTTTPGAWFLVRSMPTPSCTLGWMQLPPLAIGCPKTSP